MTSLSSTNSVHANGRSMMDQRISAAVSSGTISATDQTALESALDSIDSSLSSGAASDGKAPGGIKGRVDGLIDQQVKDGKLTDDQATELKTFFAQGGGHAHGSHRPQAASSDATDTSPQDVAAASDSDQDPAQQQLDALLAFVKQLASASATYGAAGAGASSSNTGLILDTKV